MFTTNKLKTQKDNNRYSHVYELDLALIERMKKLIPELQILLLLYPDYPVEYFPKEIRDNYIIHAFLNHNVIPETKYNYIYRGDLFENLDKIVKEGNLYDCVIMTRCIEHLSVNDIIYFFYYMSKIIKPKRGILTLVYPNMDLIVKKLQELDPTNQQFIMYNYELFNEGEKYDTHKTFTNKNVIKKLGELEGYFEEIEVKENISIESNRDIYNITIFRRT